MVGKIDKTRPIERCPCCGKNINQDPHPMCVDSSEINEQGAGFTLYFYYMKLVSILALTIALPHLPKVFLNSFAGRCDQYPGTRECTQDYISVHSIANFGYWEKDFVHLAMVYVSVVLFVIVYTYQEYRAQIYASNLEKTAITNKDYSVMARDVGTEVTKEDLIKYCEEKGAKVKEIEFAYFVPESKKTEKEIQVFREHISRSDQRIYQLEKVGKDQQSIDDEKKKIEQWKIKIDELQTRKEEEEKKEKDDKSNQFTLIAFLSFETVEQQRKILPEKSVFIVEFFKDVWYVLKYIFLCYACSDPKSTYKKLISRI